MFHWLVWYGSGFGLLFRFKSSNYSMYQSNSKCHFLQCWHNGFCPCVSRKAVQPAVHTYEHHMSPPQQQCQVWSSRNLHLVEKGDDEFTEETFVFGSFQKYRAHIFGSWENSKVQRNSGWIIPFLQLFVVQCFFFSFLLATLVFFWCCIVESKNKNKLLGKY